MNTPSAAPAAPPDDDFGDLSIAVVIPCLNEEVAIAGVVNDFRAALPSARIYVYDNASTDGTVDVAGKAGAIVRCEPGHGYSFDLSEFALPLKQATSHFDLIPISDGRSLLTVTLEFIPKFGPLGWVMGKLMMRPMLLGALRGLTKGVDDHMSTGAIVGKGGVLLAPAA